jgi:uncharacterized protein YkwD
MKLRYLLAALALTTAATDSMAGPFRRRAQPVYQQSYPQAYQPASQPTSSSPTYLPSTGTPDGGYVSFYPSTTPTVTAAPVPTEYPAAVAAPAGFSNAVPATTGFSNSMASDGLDEVNAKRAARGLRPYLRDEGLSQAAQACAAFRAQHGLFGHTSNDFGFVPAGTSASSAGCAAYPAGYGWMSCCTYDNYTYAGAAWATGRDGQRYMHLFVR